MTEVIVEEGLTFTGREQNSIDFKPLPALAYLRLIKRRLLLSVSDCNLDIILCTLSLEAVVSTVPYVYALETE
jgi:hypothetical protein